MHKAYYLVAADLRGAPLADHLLHGYESRWMFYRSLHRLVVRWQGRVGECVDRRNGFLLLRFHDTPGGKPDEEWLPCYLLQPTDAPCQEAFADGDDSLDHAFGFDEASS